MKPIQVGDCVRVALTAFTDRALARLASVWAATVVLVHETGAVIEIRRQRFQIRLSALTVLPDGTKRLPSAQPIPKHFKEEAVYQIRLRCRRQLDHQPALLAERRAA